MYGLKLLIAIVPRGKGEDVAALCRENGLTFSMISPAYGAAGTHFMDYLGLSNTEKDCVLSVVRAEFSHEMLNRVHSAMRMDEANTGIAMTIPITGVSGPRALRWISGIYPPPASASDGTEPEYPESSSGSTEREALGSRSGSTYAEAPPETRNAEAVPESPVNPPESPGDPHETLGNPPETPGKGPAFSSEPEILTAAVQPE